jgi:PII-like signaling protein
VRRIAGALGAELAGVDLSEPLDDAVIAEIRRALLDHQVIFFRDQHLTPEQHLAFGRRFGSLNVHDFVGGMADYPEIIEVRKEADDHGSNFGGMRMMDFAGATVYRGVLGYGAKGHTHKAGRFHLSHDLPIMISVVEKPDRVDELVQVVAEMMQDGIIVTSDVELHHIVHELPGSGELTANEWSAR